MCVLKLQKENTNIIKKPMVFEDLTYFEKKCINKFLDLNGRAMYGILGFSAIHTDNHHNPPL